MKTRQQYIHELWQQFSARIIEEWPQKYQSRFGEYQAFNKIQKPTLFARAVQKEINRHFAEKGIKHITIVSESTLNYAFQRGNLSYNAKDRSLDMFAVYLGFKNWLDFQYQTEVLPNIEQDEEDSKLPQELAPIVERRRKTRGIVWYIAGIFLFLGCIYTIYYLRTMATIKKIIIEANAAEFEAYKTLPKIDTAFFDLYYTKRPDNRSQLSFWLRQRAAKKSKLVDSLSVSTILECHIKYIGWKTAQVQTKEAWRLIWEGNTEKYDVINPQDYYLIYENGRWLIDINAYEGKKSKK